MSLSSAAIAALFVALAISLVFCAAVAGFAVRSWRELRRLRDRYGAIDDVETERARLDRERASLEERLATLRPDFEARFQAEKADLEQRAQREKDRLGRERAALEAEITTRRSTFEAKYAAALQELERLGAEVRLYEEKADLQSFGLYTPYYDFGTSEEYKRQVAIVRDKQAGMLQAKGAAVCHTEWMVEGSKQKGKQMTDRNLKLMLRAFNGESDAAIAKVRFNNAAAIETRIEKAFEAINKLGEPNRCAIVPQFLSLKLAELRLTHEQAQKVQAEKEEQREARERLRDEEVARKEFEKAQREAQKEEERYQDALARARAQLADARARDVAALNDKIAELETKVAEAHDRKERAISQAELTRSGHVYVISNVGAFGEGVVKIGMTRRLEPMDRVRELGDASVPFPFDVHALVYTEDAPGLENALHRTLGDSRLNLMNLRKEFFAATLDEVERVMSEHLGKRVEVMRAAVAEEYRLSVAKRNTRSEPVTHAPVVAEVERFEQARALLAEL